MQDDDVGLPGTTRSVSKFCLKKINNENDSNYYPDNSDADYLLFSYRQK